MKDLKRYEKKINSAVGRAINTYNMIEDGDRLIAGLSGGKDSFTMLHMLNRIRQWAPVDFDITAVYVRMDAARQGPVEDLLMENVAEMGLELEVEHADMVDSGDINCFWCSWNRRKVLFRTAEKMGCGKVVLGHHKNDIVETMLLNLFYKGEISAMNPLQELFGGKITIIRPLCYVEEELIRDFIREETNFKPVQCECGSADTSRRKRMKDLIGQLEQETGVNVRTNIFNSLGRVREGYTDIR